MTKIRREVSGIFRTEEGAEIFRIPRTVIETARKRGWDIPKSLSTSPDRLIQDLKPT